MREIVWPPALALVIVWPAQPHLPNCHRSSVTKIYYSNTDKYTDRYTEIQSVSVIILGQLVLYSSHIKLFDIKVFRIVWSGVSLIAYKEENGEK